MQCWTHNRWSCRSRFRHSARVIQAVRAESSGISSREVNPVTTNPFSHTEGGRSIRFPFPSAHQYEASSRHASHMPVSSHSSARAEVNGPASNFPVLSLGVRKCAPPLGSSHPFLFLSHSQQTESEPQGVRLQSTVPYHGMLGWCAPKARTTIRA